MRDLANRQYSSGSRFSLGLNPGLVKVVGTIVLILVILFIIKSRFGGMTSSSSVTLKDASYGLKPVEPGNITITKGGANLTTQDVRLRDVKYGGAAKGTATRSFGGGSYILSVDVTIPDTTGAEWEVWLVDSSGGLREVDFMRCTKNACSYTLSDTDKYSKYSTIWITRELTKEDNMPEQHVLEGEW